MSKKDFGSEGLRYSKRRTFSMFQQVCFVSIPGCYSFDAIVLFASLYTRFLALILFVREVVFCRQCCLGDTLSHYTIINLSFLVIHASSMSLLENGIVCFDVVVAVLG